MFFFRNMVGKCAGCKQHEQFEIMQTLIHFSKKFFRKLEKNR